MFLKFMFFLMFLSSISAAGCKSRDGTTSATSDAGTADLSGYLFIGCGPSIGECRHSCPQNNGIGQQDASLCVDDPGSVACYCPSGAQPVMKAPPETTHSFVGCLPSASECRYSCNSKKIITFQGSDQCQMREFACYCEL